MAVILDMFEPRSFCLDTHVDVFGHQTNKRVGMIGVQPQCNVNDPIIVGLIFIGVEKGDRGIFSDELIRKNCQCPQSTLIKI